MEQSLQLYLYLLAFIESHYITLDKSQPYTFCANNTNAQIKLETFHIQGHHMTKIAYKIVSIVLCIFFLARNLDLDPSSMH